MGKLDPVIGRENEIERVVQILSRRTKNNPVLIGEPGVGKTAIVEGLAQRIVNREVPQLLFDRRVVALDLGALVAGTSIVANSRHRMKAIMKEIVQAENVMIFIDELHTLVGAGAAEARWTPLICSSLPCRAVKSSVSVRLRLTSIASTLRRMGHWSAASNPLWLIRRAWKKALRSLRACGIAMRRITISVSLMSPSYKR